jgi:antitoxin CptB
MGVAYMAMIEAARIPGAAFSAWKAMDRDARLKRLKFRAWHRGVREADMLVGGFFNAYHAGWSDMELDAFEALLEEQDVDILAWAMGTAAVPERWQGEMMNRLRTLDYIKLP